MNASNHWVLADKHCMLAYRAGRLTVVERPSKGLPRGAAVYTSQVQAEIEWDTLQALGHFPLFTPKPLAVTLKR